MLINLLVLAVLSVACTVLSLLLRESNLDARRWPYRERRWEDGGEIYQRTLGVRHWKDRLPELSDFIPAVYAKRRIPSFSEAHLRKHLVESCRAEATHGAIILSSLLFALWNDLGDTVLMVLLATVLNAPFIVVQRANRPRIVHLLDRIERHRAASESHEEHAGPRLLVISTSETGHGHTSMLEALRAQLAKADAQVQVTEIDGFSLGWRWLRVLGRAYNPLVVNVPILWGWLYHAGGHVVWLVKAVVSRSIRKDLMRHVNETRPDVIVSLHGVFVGSVLDVLEREGLEIPVVPLIADLDNVTRLWKDTRSWCTLCPSEESMRAMIGWGIDERRLRLVGFPVREEFCAPGAAVPLAAGRRAQHPATVLFVNGSQGSRKTLRLARGLLAQTDCRVSILAGRSPALVARLERGLASHVADGRAQIHGFTPRVADHMVAADILVVRASPNVLMEAVTMTRPCVVVGALRGQEERNPAYVERYGLGVVCPSARRFPMVARDLLADDGQRLREIQAHQRRFRRPRAAREISEYLLEVARERRAAAAVPRSEASVATSIDVAVIEPREPWRLEDGDPVSP